MQEPSSPRRVRKAFAYVTHRGRLLIFSHPDFPEAGLQVPAGTMWANETPEEAVLREAWEETGIEGLRIERFLGEQELVREQQLDDESDLREWQLHHRFFFHLTFEGEPQDRWQHYELHDGLHAPTLFELFWAPLDAVPELVAEHGRYLPELRALLSV
jgi:8-oxo-dGTP pyrophosphatase MutT (NUDIX family)